MKKDDQLNKFYQKIGEVDYLSGLVTKYIEVNKSDYIGYRSLGASSCLSEIAGSDSRHAKYAERVN